MLESLNKVHIYHNNIRFMRNFSIYTGITFLFCFTCLLPASYAQSSNDTGNSGVLGEIGCPVVFDIVLFEGGENLTFNSTQCPTICQLFSAGECGIPNDEQGNIIPFKIEVQNPETGSEFTLLVSPDTDPANSAIIKIIGVEGSGGQWQVDQFCNTLYIFPPNSDVPIEATFDLDAFKIKVLLPEGMSFTTRLRSCRDQERRESSSGAASLQAGASSHIPVQQQKDQTFGASYPNIASGEQLRLKAVNPVVGDELRLFFESPLRTAAEVSVFNMQGQVVDRVMIPESAVMFTHSVNGWISGGYLLRVRFDVNELPVTLLLIKQ